MPVDDELRSSEVVGRIAGERKRSIMTPRKPGSSIQKGAKGGGMSVESARDANVLFKMARWQDGKMRRSEGGEVEKEMPASSTSSGGGLKAIAPPGNEDEEGF
ncbi:hypothetical protein G7Y89_g9649 [Cudoniella acicularis]|uniref:Uncharacterized protein n=1 Tax=Cudoniella acicularis TaxID=354080 RepID=A0A8H4RF89_9HELO|nr:hypothetical protein G7Y89_g9649 [Cudoniella acicularis]